MDSTTLINEYVSSKSALENITTLEKFSKEFPKGTPKDLIEAIFKDLALQRERVLENLKTDTCETFDLSVDDIIRYSKNHSLVDVHNLTSKKTLEDLIMRLTNLLQDLESDCTQLSTVTKKHIETITTSIDELSDIRHSKRKPGNHALVSLIADASNSVTKIQSIINNS